MVLRPGKSSVVPQQAPRLDLQALCDAGNIVDRNISLSPLDRAEIGAVDSTLVRQSFLAEAPRSPHVLSQDVP